MKTFSTLTFLHIYSYLKIYGVINVDFCVNCKQFSLCCFLFSLTLGVHCFIVSIQWRKTIKSLWAFRTLRNPTFICTTCPPLEHDEVVGTANASQLSYLNLCRCRSLTLSLSLSLSLVQQSVFVENNIQQNIYRSTSSCNSCACVFGLQHIINISRSGQSVYFEWTS